MPPPEEEKPKGKRRIRSSKADRREKKEEKEKKEKEAEGIAADGPTDTEQQRPTKQTHRGTKAVWEERVRKREDNAARLGLTGSKKLEPPKKYPYPWMKDEAYQARKEARRQAAVSELLVDTAGEDAESLGVSQENYATHYEPFLAGIQAAASEPDAGPASPIGDDLVQEDPMG
ncbi:hypothetical protein MBLNU457_3244t2 [Dothideomycetes sp. NU457]